MRFSVGLCFGISFILASCDSLARNSSPAVRNEFQQEVFFRSLLESFQGDFDNYNQVVRDYNEGLSPGTGGGHEHIHCTIVPHENENEIDCLERGRSSSWVLAAYYFDGVPSKIFRFRMYELKLLEYGMNFENIECDVQVCMNLYTLKPEVEKLLRTISSCPEDWWSSLKDYTQSDLDRESLIQNICETLPGCEVIWQNTSDRSKHGYLFDSDFDVYEENNCGAVAHAYMKHAPVEVDSQMVPGLRMKIMDELSLWHDQLFINDRGFDLNGNFVYGNQRGVPYKMDRVASFASNTRKVLNESLAWTLGPSFRRDDKEYETKINEIGGTTTRFSQS